MTEHSRRATVVEFHKDASGHFHPFSLTVEGGDHRYREIYDIEHSRQYGYLFEQSGSGGTGPVKVSGPYFVTGNIDVEEAPCTLVDPDDRPPWNGSKTKVIRARNRTRRLRALPKAFAVDANHDILDWCKDQDVCEVGGEAAEAAVEGEPHG